jgi:hypothetical protein
MPGKAGLLEVVAQQLGLALQPLEEQLKPESFLDTLAQLGLRFPSEALQPGVTATLGAGSNAAGALRVALGQLTTNIANDNELGIASSGATVLAELRNLINALDPIGTALSATAGMLPGMNAGEVVTFANDLPMRLLGHFVINRLEAALPSLVGLANLLGIIDYVPSLGVPRDPTHPAFVSKRLRLENLTKALSAPQDLIKARFHWGAADFDGRLLLPRISDALSLAGMHARYEDLGTPFVDAGMFTLTLDPATAPPRLAFRLLYDVPANFDVTLPLTKVWSLQLQSRGSFAAGLEATATPPANISIKPPVGPQPEGLALTFLAKPAGPFVILGQAGGSRLQVESFTLRAGLSVDAGGGTLAAHPDIGIEFVGGKAVIDAGAASGLLASLLGIDDLQSDFTLALNFSLEHGLTFGASPHLQKRLASDISLGPVKIDALTLDLGFEGGAIPVGVLADVRATAGPLTVEAAGIGFVANLTFPAQAQGNLGPLDIAPGFKAPTGIGLSLDAGPVSGGGFLLLDPAGNRYGGVLQLKLLAVSVTAFGLYELTSQGRASFVAVLGIRFNPGIQLSFGFALQGVGGLVGINRRADADMLRERLASGASGNVLFCDDPLHKAASLLGDLGMFFPTAPAGFLVGPTLQISWLAPLVRLDVGIVLQFPGPSKILLLGSVRSMIGVDESLALLYVRMDFMGAVDTGAQLISFDAQLVNSHALGILHLTGGTALRIGYGSPPYIVLTIGGFHPRFDPAPLQLPVIPRIGASLDASFIARVYLRLEMYLALTSNTLQTGAHVQAGMELGPLSASGHFDFDALVQFRPFWFEADFSAGFAVEAFDISFASVDIDGHISGPGPMVIHAHGSVRRLGIKVSGSATFELGDDNKDAPPAVASVVQALKDELSRSSNLRAAGEDRGVILANGRPAPSGVIVLPRGQLIWEQKRAPLKTIIQRFEGIALDGAAHELHVAPPAGWTASDEQDWFACGSFAALDLKASQTLNNTTFQQLPSGVQIGAGADKSAPDAVAYTAQMQLVKKPALRLGTFAVGAYMSSALTAALRNRGTMPPIDAGVPAVSVSGETFDVHGSGGTTAHAEQAPFQAFQLSRQKPGSIAVPSADVTVTL